MSEVGAAFGADDFGALHSLGVVGAKFDCAWQSSVEARPTGAGVEFGGRRKKWCVTDNTGIHAILGLMYILAGKRGFGALLTKNMILLLGELLFYFFFIHIDNTNENSSRVQR